RRWLLGIASRIILERKRSIFRQARALFGYAQRPGADLQTKPADGDRLDVASALEQLGPEKRVVIVLAEVEGYTCEEIGRMLGVPIGTVWTRLHHARKTLRAWFEQEAKR